MKYRSKLYLGFIAIAVLSVIIALSIIFIEIRSVLFHQLQSKLLSVVTTAAATIDSDKLKQIHSFQDQNSNDYRYLQQFLRKIRDANRRSDLFVQFLYTVGPSPTDPSQPVFGIDTEENPTNFSHVGDLDPDAIFHRLLQRDHEPFVARRIFKDRWGAWLTAYAPVYDASGNYIASIAADMGADYVYSALHRFLIEEIPALGGAILLAAIIAAFMSATASSSLAALKRGVDSIAKGDLNYTVHLKTDDEFSAVGLAINQMAKGLRERERLKTGFARYVSQHVLEQIISSEAPTKLAGERRRITVLFSDIRQFTTLSEKLDPEAVVALLNEYFEHMLEAIFSNNGTFDKFIGDGLMAEFGAPLEDADQEKNAVLAALSMLKAMHTLNKKWKSEGRPTVEIGIGIHTGQAIVGNIGTEDRMEYTAIGDTVNVAARLEKATKAFKTPIIISESTHQGLQDQFPTQSLGPLFLEGRTEEILAFAVHSIDN